MSETSMKMHNSVMDAHEKSKELDKSLKDLGKEVQILSKEKEAIEKQRTEAIKKRAKLELDDKDLKEKITGNAKAKVSTFNLLIIIYHSTPGSMCSKGNIVAR